LTRKKSKKARGMMLLLIQYFKNGYLVAAKKVKCLLKSINVVMFQHMIKTPIATPTKAALIEFTLPKYSGARYKASAPNGFMKLPFTVAKRMNQNNSNAWYFLKCRKSN
jgi:hypothetical protein